ncbi:MAG: transcriptional regulator GutM [Escherichia coli]|nr:transcriptional regulator GutM [Escherichia coli]
MRYAHQAYRTSATTLRKSYGIRVVVAIALDDQQRIVDTLFMKGLTVFARPQKIPAITGMHAGDLQPDVIFPHDPLSQNALSLALKLKRG